MPRCGAILGARNRNGQRCAPSLLADWVLDAPSVHLFINENQGELAKLMKGRILRLLVGLLLLAATLVAGTIAGLALYSRLRPEPPSRVYEVRYNWDQGAKSINIINPKTGQEEGNLFWRQLAIRDAKRVLPGLVKTSGLRRAKGRFLIDFWDFDHPFLGLCPGDLAAYKNPDVIFQARAVGGIVADIPQANRVILATGAWTPSAAETQKALVAIQFFLERPASGNRRSIGEIKQILGNAKNYRVQFVGVVREQRKLIWCNFFPVPLLGEKDDEFENWKSAVVEVMDGGYWFWQIAYDPITGKCRDFWANGYA